MSLSKDQINQIKPCVTFVFVRNKKNEWVPNGTGFFVGVKNEKDPTRTNVYLVTAKHVIYSDGGLLPSIAIRLNCRSGDAQLIELQVKQEDVAVHADADVDIAVVPCLPDQAIYDFLWLPSELLCNQEIIDQNNICEGDDVLFAGLFTSHVGQKRNQPIIRFGRIALMSDEKVEWREDKGKPTKLLDLYLLECQSFGGNSGSPVFFILSTTRAGQLRLGGPMVYLAGIMRGSFLNLNEIQLIETQQSAVSAQNIGIAAVTPAYQLYDILFSEKLLRQRGG